MKVNCIFHKLTSEQTALFNAVAPIVERYFPMAHAYTDADDNQIWFECGYDERIAVNKVVYHEPNGEKLKTVCAYLNNLAKNQESKIQFEICSYDYGMPVPAAIRAKW